MDHINNLALELSELRRALIARDIEADFRPIVEESEMPLPNGDWEFDRASARAGALVNELDRQLTSVGWEPPARTAVRPFGESWVYGVVPRSAPLRTITRGFLQPVRRVPLVPGVPEKVVLYLITMLPDGRDGLDRDRHGGVGYHYHYLDRNRRRSDVILSFDTRWDPPATTPPHPDQALRPLFVETHAEGKAHFTAKPWNWCDEKRLSMYEVCARDLLRGIDLFRCAANGSDAVWPRWAMLTPHPERMTRARTPAPSTGRNGKPHKRR